MSVRIVGEGDVHQLLPAADCVEAMAEVLAELARGGLFNPLRAVVRPPDTETLLGLMPSYRGGDAPLYALKVIVISPSNSTRGLDSHQGYVSLSDGVTGEVRGLVNASAITAIRTAAVSAVATRALAREDAKTLAILGAGVQGKAHLDALPVVRDFDRIVCWSRSSTLDGAEAAASVEEALADADVVVTATTAREPIVRRDWLKPGAHVNAVGSSIPTTRELDTETMAAASLYVDRRESTLNESGDYLIAAREGAIGEDHIRAELGEVLAGQAEGRRSDDELTVFKSLGIGVEDLAAAELVLRRAEEQDAGVMVDL
jgi:ornithine cyclodeaminase/alanine dehydrogenase-like protein (mu-crystallin family)